MRDNSKRVGASADPAPQQAPMLDFATPTELVDLPSQGRFYPPDHPLHGQETVEIKFMTARDEDILTSPSLLKKGIAIDRFLQNVIADKSIRVESLLSGDKAALMIASRINGYGSDYETKMTCPSCEKVAKTTFDLSELGIYHGDDYDEEEIRPTGKGTFIIKAPRTGFDVEVRLMTSRDEAHLVQKMKKISENSADNTSFTDQLRLTTVSVNGLDTPDVLNAFINGCPAVDARHIRNTYAKLVPGPDMKQGFKCPACSFEQEVDIPMTVDFFWTNQ